jgi:cell division protease FtsH
MGPLTFGKKEGQIFLGREIAQHQDYSEDTAVRIDHEVKRIVTENFARARSVLQQHREKLDRVAEELLLREVLDADQVRRIVNGESLDEQKSRLPAAPAAPASDESGRRPQRERPAIVPTITKPVTQE